MKQILLSFHFQLQNNLLDSYSAPPGDAFASSYRPAIGLTPPNIFSYSHGLGNQNHQFPNNFRYPISVQYNPPKQPLAFRSPVPKGLIESIALSVQQQDTFGAKFLQKSPIYLPPPTNEIPPPPHGK